MRTGSPTRRQPARAPPPPLMLAGRGRFSRSICGEVIGGKALVRAAGRGNGVGTNRGERLLVSKSEIRNFYPSPLLFSGGMTGEGQGRARRKRGWNRGDPSPGARPSPPGGAAGEGSRDAEPWAGAWSLPPRPTGTNPRVPGRPRSQLPPPDASPWTGPAGQRGRGGGHRFPRVGDPRRGPRPQVAPPSRGPREKKPRGRFLSP